MAKCPTILLSANSRGQSDRYCIQASSDSAGISFSVDLRREEPYR